MVVLVEVSVRRLVAVVVDKDIGCVVDTVVEEDVVEAVAAGCIAVAAEVDFVDKVAFVGIAEVMAAVGAGSHRMAVLAVAAWAFLEDDAEAGVVHACIGHSYLPQQVHLAKVEIQGYLGQSFVHPCCVNCLTRCHSQKHTWTAGSVV